ncbi:hypothetical protein [Winogradskyella aquimaris]|uniref:Uncharacterized protein n=1 Tax=Winogradskyella aquimaris TaxID=864074 RepID=A0ABU5EMU2_9FLAO|nr:hypothetical protein [Winogradskyella aquimaris]MDY2587770.1 hypothetical protein [Winogradskyella aquimaris]
MVLNNIEKLIEKYNNAETTLAEEAQLREYFTSEDVAPHLEHYKPMFVYFSQAQQEQYTKDVPLKPKRTLLYQWISVAAVAVLMLGFIIPQILGPSQEELRQKELAMETYNKTMEALSLVSLGINEGKEQLNSLALVSDNLNQGLEEASRLTEFSKATNRIFKNK